jgi:hypothetical protein
MTFHIPLIILIPLVLIDAYFVIVGIVVTVAGVFGL